MAKFRLQRLRGGRKHIVQTDSAADYLRCLIDEMAFGDPPPDEHVEAPDLRSRLGGPNDAADDTSGVLDVAGHSPSSRRPRLDQSAADVMFFSTTSSVSWSSFVGLNSTTSVPA